MKRRRFLATMGATAAAAALWPSLIRRAFADASFDAPGAKKTAPGLPTSQKHIDPSRRPQLVIIVPADDGEKDRRGGVWGEYLNHGQPAQIAPLAAVDVSCATMAELGPLAKGIKGEPLAILFSRDGSVRAIDAKLPEAAPARRFDPSEDAVVDKRIAAMAKMLAGALPPVPAGEVHAAAARVVRAVREHPPAGSHWANASGCGPATVENMKEPDGDEVVGYGCGMGHVPEKSTRFLYFFAKTPQQMEREWMKAEEAKQKSAAAKKAAR